MKKVEGDENGTRGALAGECGMEREEVRDAVLSDHDGLAINDGAPHLQSREGAGNAWKAIGPAVPPAGVTQMVR
jgi:hypothetical protein